VGSIWRHADGSACLEDQTGTDAFILREGAAARALVATDDNCAATGEPVEPGRCTRVGIAATRHSLRASGPE
jgi:hypothetical protein